MPGPESSESESTRAIVRNGRSAITGLVKTFALVTMSKRSPCDEDLSAGHSVQSASPPPLSPAPVSLEYIISQVRDVLTGKAAVRKISNVTSELCQQLDAQAQVDVNLAGWDGVKWVYSGTVHDLVGAILTSFSSRVDFHRGDLIVGCKVSFGNEIMTALFLDLQRDNTSYPIHYGTSQIRTFGQANIDLTVGSKSPDYALYEVVGDENSTNITPTIAWEIGYAENERKLEMDAARLICLSKGLVQLVVTVKITHEPNTFPKMLKQVVWHHWEIDVARFGQVDDPTNTLLLNNPVPHPQGDQTSPPPYEAHVEIDKDIYRLVAHVTESYHVRHWLLMLRTLSDEMLNKFFFCRYIPCAMGMRIRLSLSFIGIYIAIPMSPT